MEPHGFILTEQLKGMQKSSLFSKEKQKRKYIQAKNYKMIYRRAIVYLVIEKNDTRQICAKVRASAKRIEFKF